MKVQYTDSFRKQYKKIPVQIQNAFAEKLELFLLNRHHPSLRVKKVEGTQGKIWEGSITINYRFTFQINVDIIVFRQIGTHDILRRP